MDLLPLIAFAISTGFALTFDVGVYALVRFAIRPAGSTVVRFAVEVGIAHAILLVVGAAAAAALEAALKLDFIVDLLALVLLTIVVIGVARRSPSSSTGSQRDAEPPTQSAKRSSNALSWVTAFALSLDALLVAPAANGLLGDAPIATRLATLAGITLAIIGFTALFAAFACRLQRWMFSESSTSVHRLLRIAHFAELLVFCSLWATSALKSIEHLVDHAYSTGAWGIALGLVVAIVLFLWDPGAHVPPRTAQSSA